MTISSSEIRSRALSFANEWKDESSERAEGKTFLDQFFNVFGISRRRVANFEFRTNKNGYIDCLFPGKILIEQKSSGQNLDRAHEQARDYFSTLTDEQLPSHILVSDFQRFRLYDLEGSKQYDFKIKELHKKTQLFNFLLNFKRQELKDEDPVNGIAANLLGDLHDVLKESGYDGHKLEVFMVRILFCLFADDTGIFEPPDQFHFFLENFTKSDGSDLGQQLSFLFQILNTPHDLRPKNVDEEVLKFEYINGELYSETLQMPSFDSTMRELLLKCCRFDWSKISPAIFGSIFQSIKNKEERRAAGEHYTSEKNILKVVRSLFLDDLWNEFHKAKNSKTRLQQLHDRIAQMKFFDPACGCGNFLVITYRELRKLELEIINSLLFTHLGLQKGTREESGYAGVDIRTLAKIDVDKFFGIELFEWPARIAEVAMWLIDHQMNIALSEEFGDYYRRLPLKKSPHIKQANSLLLDWQAIIQKNELSYILGNPPFIAKKNRGAQQNRDQDLVCHEIDNRGLLDYVCNWYVKAANYIQGTSIKCAFVSTNSITQGEQVGVLWNYLFKRNIKINFAHRTFRWINEARGKAAVYCVIIGFDHESEIVKDDTAKPPTRKLYDYETVTSEPIEIVAKNINPYLVDFDDIVILNRSKPICNVPEILFGNMPNDDGNFLFTDEEKSIFLKEEPDAAKFIKQLISSKEYLHGNKRWCLWLKNIKPNELRSLPLTSERVKKVKEYRLNSTRETTRLLADTPTLFGEIRQPESEYVLIPRHSSENRKYVPFGFFDANYIVHDSCLSIVNASLYHFGIISSHMHMAWLRAVCGRIKSDYRYSNSLVYNNFSWPLTPPSQKISRVEKAAKQILNVRLRYQDSTLADLYDQYAMPPDLTKAHKELDDAVDDCYVNKNFPTELSRLEFLFEMYRKITEPLLKIEKKKRIRT